MTTQNRYGVIVDVHLMADNMMGGGYVRASKVVVLPAVPRPGDRLDFWNERAAFWIRVHDVTYNVYQGDVEVSMDISDGRFGGLSDEGEANYLTCKVVHTWTQLEGEEQVSAEYALLCNADETCPVCHGYDTDDDGADTDLLYDPSQVVHMLQRDGWGEATYEEGWGIFRLLKVHEGSVVIDREYRGRLVGHASE